jgi:hypothetical protein
LLSLAFAAAGSACTYKTQDSEVLPWLKRTDSSTSFGGLGGSRKTVYSTRVLFFFWHELDAWAITVLDADTVLVRGQHGEALLRRGETTPVRFRRLHAAGNASIDVVVAAAGADQVLLQPSALFYDRKAQPYFVSIAARAAPDFRSPRPGLRPDHGGRRPNAHPASAVAAEDRQRLFPQTAWESAAGTALLTPLDVEREIYAGTSPMRRR